MKSSLHFSSVMSALSAKRFLLLFFTLFALSIPTWAWNISANTVIYFDASSFESIGTNKVVLMVGHNTWSQGYEMTKVEGSIYEVTMPKWDNCTQLAFFLDDAVLSGTNKKIADRTSSAIKTTAVFTIDSNLSTRASFYVDGSLHRENGAMANIYYDNTNVQWDDANIYI